MFASNAKIFSDQFNPHAGIREVLERKSLNLEISLSTESSLDEQIQDVSFCVGTGISPNTANSLLVLDSRDQKKFTYLHLLANERKSTGKERRV